MKNMPLITVIVPVYKVEAYLDKCVSSIVDQSYRNLEILLVDDGSPDNCPAMCDAWAKKDRRIKVIHKKNGGLSDARNAGMAIASGELMGFVDSDDWISPDMYQMLYECIEEKNSDIAAIGVEMIWEDGTPSRMLTKPGCCVLNREEAMRAIIEESWLKQPVWYKLYRTNLIRDILFPVGKYHEDVFWSYQAVARAKRVSVFDMPCYHYTQRDNSIMGEGYSLKRLDALEAKSQRQKFIADNFPELVNSAKIDLLFSCIYSMQMALMFLSGSDLDVARKKIRVLLRKEEPYSFIKGASMKQLIWCACAGISFEGTCRLRNLFGIGK